MRTGAMSRRTISWRMISCANDALPTASETTIVSVGSVGNLANLAAFLETDRSVLVPVSPDIRPPPSSRSKGRRIT
jgi:hypothetical protein